MTVASPGPPDHLSDGSDLISRVNQQDSYTDARNPRLVRVLSDLRIPTHNGGGIPRICQQMQAAFLDPPRFDMDDDQIAVTLRNEVTVSQPASSLMGRISQRLSADQQKVVINAAQDGQISNADVRILLGLDFRQSQAVLDGLQTNGMLVHQPDDPWSRYIVNPALTD